MNWKHTIIHGSFAFSSEICHFPCNIQASHVWWTCIHWFSSRVVHHPCVCIPNIRSAYTSPQKVMACYDFPKQKCITVLYRVSLKLHLICICLLSLLKGLIPNCSLRGFSWQVLNTSQQERHHCSSEEAEEERGCQRFVSTAVLRVQLSSFILTGPVHLHDFLLINHCSWIIALACVKELPERLIISDETLCDPQITVRAGI